MDEEGSTTDWHILVCTQELLSNAILTNTGRRIVELQASLGMLSMPEHFRSTSQEVSREHPEHPDLEGLEALTEETKTTYVNPKRIADLARNTGLPDVMRWVPRDVSVPTMCSLISTNDDSLRILSTLDTTSYTPRLSTPSWVHSLLNKARLLPTESHASAFFESWVSAHRRSPILSGAAACNIYNFMYRIEMFGPSDTA